MIDDRLSDPPAGAASQSRFQRLLTWPLRHSAAIIGIAIVAAILAVMGVRRIHMDASLQPMFPRGSQAGGALVRVMNDFDAVDELLVLASLPDAHAGADPDRLLAFGRRFETAVRQSPSAASLTAGIQYRLDDQARAFFEKVLVPSGIFYLDDQAFAAAQQRLTRQGMQEQIARDQAMLATPGPAAGALAKVFMQDPLRLHEFLMDRLRGQWPIRTYPGSDAMISADGRSLLIRVRGTRPPSDLEFCKGFTTAIATAADRANTDGLRLEYAGAYAIAATSARAVRSDMIGSVVGSVICLQLLFLLAYRGAFRRFAIALLPIAVGVLLGFGAYSVGAATLSPMTAVLGGILAGMAIDYSIQYLSTYEDRRAAGDTSGRAAETAVIRITPAAFAAWATSVIGFLAIGASSVPMLREFSILGSLGLAGAFFAVVALGPMLMMRTDRAGERVTPGRSRVRWPLIAPVRWIGRHSRVSIAASSVVALIAILVLLPGRRDLLPLESDLTVMHPRPNPALAAQDRIARTFGISPDSILVHLQANSPESLVALAHDVEQRLRDDAGQRAGIVGSYGLATLLPDPRVARSRLAYMGDERADQVVNDFRSVITDAGFDPDATALRNYATFLHVLLTRTSAPSIEGLVSFRTLAETMLPRKALADPAHHATEAIALLFMRDPLDQRAARDRAVEGVRAALAGLPGATPTGLSVIAYDAESAVRHDLPRLSLIAIGAVAIYLAIHFRNVSDALLALLPTAFSLLVLLAAMRLAGQRLNMINLVALPLLIGIDVDYGIFLVSLARPARVRRESADQLTARLAPVCHAVLLCGLATLIGFGSLMWTSVPAVRSLGFAVAVGIAACLVACFSLVIPLIFLAVQFKKSP